MRVASSTKIRVGNGWCAATCTVFCITLTCIASFMVSPTRVHAQSRMAEAAVVTVASVRDHKFTARTWMSGSIVPLSSASVVPLISGFSVMSLWADTGDVVKKGDILARFDSAELTAELEKVEAQIAKAQADINQAQSGIESAQAQADQAASSRTRTQTLMDRGDLAQATMDTAIADDLTAQAAVTSATEALASERATLRELEASRGEAKLTLERTKLRAPVGGLIAAKNLKIGDISDMSGDPAFVIYKDAELEIEAQVVETALGSLSVGDDVQVSIAGLPDRTGTVRRIAPTVDNATRLGAVNISLADTTGVRAGLFTSGWIITETRDNLSVPVTAIQNDAEGTFVLLVKDGVLVRCPVEAGLTSDGQREILSGLSKGQSVVARAGGFFADGDLVTPLEDATQ